MAEVRSTSDWVMKITLSKEEARALWVMMDDLVTVDTPLQDVYNKMHKLYKEFM